MKEKNKIVVLAGGVGAARFLEGLVQAISQEQITVIVNTGDDKEFYGLHVSPDIDIVMYTLAGVVNPMQGWGFTNDTYHTMQQLTMYGNDQWFQLGDKDLATHIHRTNLLKQGKTLTEVTENLRKSFNIKLRILPMTNESVQTHIKTSHGLIHFQEYMVKHRTEDEVQGISFLGIDSAKPTPEVIDAIKNASAIILAPSNPLVSIGSILFVPGIRKAFHTTQAKVVAVSPIIDGKTIKGPADKMMQGMGMEASAVGVAKCYQDFLDVMIIDNQDKSLKKEIEELGIKVITTNTIMKDIQAKKGLAEKVLDVV